MERTSKVLLQFEHKIPSTSSLESTLRVCENDSLSSQRKKTDSLGEPITAPVPKSQVMGKVKDFLGVLSEANKRLQLDAKDNSENYDIEMLSGNESQIIEMDLMLGIADLRTPEAVAAAESAIAGHQPVIPLAVDSSGSKSDYSSDEDNDSEHNDYEDDEKTSSSKLKGSESAKDNSSNVVGKNKSERKSKIIDMDLCHLMLGIADLRTPEAVAAAESAIAGHQPVIPLAVDSSGSESDDSNDEDNDSEHNDYEDDEKTSSTKLKGSESAKDNSSNVVGKNKSERKSKIIDMDLCQ